MGGLLFLFLYRFVFTHTLSPLTNHHLSYVLPSCLSFTTASCSSFPLGLDFLPFIFLTYFFSYLLTLFSLPPSPTPPSLSFPSLLPLCPIPFPRPSPQHLIMPEMKLKVSTCLGRSISASWVRGIRSFPNLPR